MATMNDQEEYLKAFRGDESDNQVDDSAPEGEAESPAVAVVIDPVSAVDSAAPESDQSGGGEQMPQEAMAPTEPDGDEQAPVGQGQGEQLSPEDIQRQKSWEGRLRKREEELAAREAAMSGKGAQEVVDDAEIAEIQSRLSEDFGEDFVKMIMKLAGYEAQKYAESGVSEKIGGIASVIDQIINDTKEAFSAMHYGAIADAHEDFREIAESEEFQQWLASMPDAKRAEADAIIQSGRPGQVIKLLTAYKDFCNSQNSANEADDLAMDAASGVRSSSPVKLPDRVPSSPDDEYRAAWASM